MRTTLTLEDDVAKALQRLQEKEKKPFRTVLNEVLRAGLSAGRLSEAAARQPYQAKALSASTAKVASLDNIAEVLSLAEGDDQP